eukprot:TRINITY_DN8730_c2_g1_i2.p2 TRINITY_DN8730_c2_g1~~TRINITY_DN8730_c2_g1_i2.p2  ORF type:complete len:118 (-),score=11.05 TRINITY_DN8730_c2_g1_i2:131-460(-)
MYFGWEDYIFSCERLGFVARFTAQQQNFPDYTEQVMESQNKQDISSSTLNTAFKLSQVLDTGLNERQVELACRLLKNGANPEALAKVFLELQRNADLLKQTQRSPISCK